MNWHYLKTFLWLRSRLRANQMKRGGTGAYIIHQIILACMIVLALVGFTALFFLGATRLGAASPSVIMLIWDGLVAALLLFWMGGLVADLQRSELLSLDKFLHLPISLSGVFLINYAASIVNASVILFVPGMVGLAAGLVVSRGPGMLLLLPVLAAFVLMLTAVTYQFRGWLAALMVNKRRRRTIVTIATVIFALMFQVPQFLRFSGMGRNPDGSRQRTTAGMLGQVEQFADGVAAVNLLVPLGWLPYGAKGAAQGSAAIPLLAMAGLGLIGAFSLRRSYRTTVQLYTGHFTARGPAKNSADAASGKDAAAPASSASFLERRLPWISEHASAVALTHLRSVTRAPEAKMILLSPVVMAIVFGSMFMRGSTNPSAFMRPLMASGAIVMILFSITQLAGNQFGFDRSGFRAFVLSPLPRRDILVGKNIALFPITAALAGVVVTVVQLFYPMRIDHFAAALVQMVSMYLVFSIIANYMSILAPVPMSAGSLQPHKPTGSIILLHLAFFFLFPIALAPTLIPLGIEYALSAWGWPTPVPIYLLLAIVELIVVGLLYPAIVDSQGSLLQRREQRILEVVTRRVE